jgi:hypothetical protein
MRCQLTRRFPRISPQPAVAPVASTFYNPNNYTKDMSSKNLSTLALPAGQVPDPTRVTPDYLCFTVGLEDVADIQQTLQTAQI